MSPARDRLAFAAAAVAYTALALYVQRDLAMHLANGVYHQAMVGQDCLLHVWTIAWGQHALATEPCRLLDANIFFPQLHTLLYSDHLLGLALLLSPLRLVTDNTVLIHNVVTIAAPALNAFAFHLLLRDLTGRHTAAFVGALAFGFAPIRLTMDRCQIQMLAAWWIPLAMYAAQRAIRRDRWGWALLAGTALAFQALTGIYMTAFFTPFLVVAHLVWLQQWPLRSHPGWWRLLAAEAAAVAVQLPFLVAYRGVQSDLGAHRPALLNALLSLQLNTLPEIMPLATLLVLGAAAIILGRRLPAPLRGQRAIYLTMVVGGIVLALGPAMMLPGDRGTVWGPYALLANLPGFSALRVPARMVHVTIFGAAVLAGGGFAAATVHRRGLLLVLAMCSAAAAVLVEGRIPRFQLLPAPRPARMDTVYPWLATQPATMRIVELPIDPYGVGMAYYQYASTAHWKPALNGTSGILPPIGPYMQKRLERFPEDDVIAELVALGITHAVVHTERLAPADAARLDAAATRRHVLKARWTSPRTVVYALRPSLRAPAIVPNGEPLPHQGWTITASAAADTAARAIDDDPDSTWSSWGDLDRGLRERWYDPSSVLARWKDYLDHQPARLTLDLGRERTVTALTAHLGGSDPMAVPTIGLEWSADGKRWKPFPGRFGPVPDVRALVHDARAAVFGATAPGVHTRWLRLSGQSLDWLVGDVAVYGR
ncbi:MAG TPA: hypothetical protein VGR62_03935 [Candidatus Binatia bacterium]|nr:hypothetical protein [Candidatus Binatia bacterium]